MSTVSTYLNFGHETEQAFLFYRSVFGGEFKGGIRRFGDMPSAPDAPPMPESVKNLVMHVALEITGGHILMGTDAPEALGFQVTQGNNFHISIYVDHREEADRLYRALSEEGKIQQEMQEMFWGAYFGSFTDKFGVHWMINHNPQ